MRDLVLVRKSVKLFCVRGMRRANLCPTVARWSLRTLGIQVGSRITVLLM